MSDREVLEVDVLIVGGGLAGLSCAIHLIDEAKRHNRVHPGKQLDMPNVLVIEKGAGIGIWGCFEWVLCPTGKSLIQLGDRGANLLWRFSDITSHPELLHIFDSASIKSLIVSARYEGIRLTRLYGIPKPRKPLFAVFYTP